MHALLQNMLIHHMHTWYSKHLSLMGFRLSQSFMPNSYTNACNVVPNGRANKKSSSTKP